MDANRRSLGGRIAVGHPVDVASGAFFNHWTDLSLGGLVPLAVRRFYSTSLLDAEQAPGGLGPGWRLSLQMSLRQTLEGFAFVDGEGVERHLEDSHGDFERSGQVSSAALGMRLRRLGKERVGLVRFGFDRDPLELVFEREPSGVNYALVSIRRNEKARLDFTYDRKGRVAKAWLARQGRGVRLSYDGTGRLESVRLLQAFESEGELVVRYEHDARGRLTRVFDEEGVHTQYGYDAQGRMCSEASRSGAVYSAEYDLQGRCVHVSGADHFQERWLQYEPSRQVTRVTDSHGAVFTYEYNASGQVTQWTSPMGLKTSYEYDDAGRLSAQVLSRKQRFEYTYDEAGRLRSVALPGGLCSSFEHDADHRLVSSTEWTGLTARLSYDSDGNLQRVRLPDDVEWRYESNSWGERVRIVNPLGADYQCHYDGRGNLVSEVDAHGSVWRREYNTRGQPVSEVDPLGQLTRYEYDRRHWLARRVEPDGLLSAWEYSADGAKLVSRGPGGRVRTVLYNACGKPVEVVDADGGRTTLRWDTEPNRLLEVQNPRGETYRMDYDAEGRVIRRRCWDGRVFTHEWDGELLSATVDPLGQRVEYTYNALGNLVCRAAPEGELRYEYDASGRVVKLSKPGSVISYEYDELQRIRAEVVDGQRLERRFDALGHVTQLATPLAGDVGFRWAATGECSGLSRAWGELRFVHDPLGREVRRDLPGGAHLDQEYDVTGHLRSQEFFAPGDARKGPAFARSYSYGPGGRLSMIEDSLRGRTVLTHSREGVMTGFARWPGDAELYVHDALGSRLWEVGVASETGWLEGMLASFHRQDSTAAENLARKQGADFSRREYDAGGRLLRIEATDRVIEYVYDAAGQVVTKRVRHGSGELREWRLKWTSEGALAAVTSPDGERWSYTYDACGRRIRKQGPRGETRYIWNQDVLLHEVDEAGHVRTWLHSPGTRELVAQEDGGHARMMLCDWVGAPSEAVSLSGELEWQSQRSAWGHELHAVEEMPARLPGQWFDAETGFHYNLFRYYDPDSGRYLSPDPLDLDGGLDAYTYVHSPLTATDRLGLGGKYFPRRASTQNPGPFFFGDTGHPLASGQPTTARFTDAGVLQVQDGNGGFQRIASTDVGAVLYDNGQPIYATRNGTGGQQAWQSEKPRYWHAEQQNLNHALANAGHLQGREGPIRLSISQPPCGPDCMGRVPILAQDLANRTGRTVHVDWEAGDAGPKGSARFDPQPPPKHEAGC